MLMQRATVGPPSLPGTRRLAPTSRSGIWPKVLSQLSQSTFKPPGCSSMCVIGLHGTSSSPRVGPFGAASAMQYLRSEAGHASWAC